MARVGNRAPIIWHLTDAGYTRAIGEAYRAGYEQARADAMSEFRKDLETRTPRRAVDFDAATGRPTVGIYPLTDVQDKRQ